MKIKLLITMLFVFTLIICLYSSAVHAQNNADSIEVYVNNNKIITEVQPQKKNDCVLIPLRATFESLGADVKWDNASKTATVRIKDINIKVKSNEDFVTINNKKVQVIGKSIIVDNRMLISYFMVSQAIGINVDYADCLNAVFIYSDTLPYKNISPCKAHSIMKVNFSIFLLDVRTKEEYNQKHIPNSNLIPIDKLESEITHKVPDKSKTIIVYCKSGKRSLQAAQVLAKLGYKDIYNLVGGIDSWEFETEGSK